MKLKKSCSVTRWIFGVALVGFANLSHAAPLIVLPVGEIARLSYIGEELFHDTNGNSRADTGEVFEGVVAFTRIQGAASGTDFSGQLIDKELTGSFRFSVIDHSSDFSHLEFGLLPGDFFNFYVGQGSSKNFDPSAPDAFGRASDGELWLSIQPGPFFESVNDRQPDGSTLNRAWADVTVNNTGHVLIDELLRTMLGKDAEHNSGGQFHGDHAAQSIFDNRVAGLSQFSPQFTFNIFGELHVFAIPEPSTWLLILIGMGAGLSFRRDGRAKESSYKSGEYA